MADRGDDLRRVAAMIPPLTAGMRTALITGGAGGLGQATARRFAADGLRVVITDLDGAAAERAAADLPGAGHAGLALDVTQEADVAAAFAAAERLVGPIAVLASFAGTVGAGAAGQRVRLEAQTLPDWDRVLAINCTGAFLCLREYSRCRARVPVEQGRVILVSSTAAQIGGLQTGAAYSASKAAVLGLTKAAARDLAAQGITVNAIAPGPIDTPMLRSASGGQGEGGTFRGLSQIPVGRVGLPDEIAEAASYLASPGAAFVTGSTLDVNGGFYMN